MLSTLTRETRADVSLDKPKLERKVNEPRLRLSCNPRLPHASRERMLGSDYTASRIASYYTFARSKGSESRAEVDGDEHERSTALARTPQRRAQGWFVGTSRPLRELY